MTNQSSLHLKVAALLILNVLVLGTNYALCQTAKEALNPAAPLLTAQIDGRNAKPVPLAPKSNAGQCLLDVPGKPLLVVDNITDKECTRYKAKTGATFSKWEPGLPVEIPKAGEPCSKLGESYGDATDPKINLVCSTEGRKTPVWITSEEAYRIVEKWDREHPMTTPPPEPIGKDRFGCDPHQHYTTYWNGHAWGVSQCTDDYPQEARP